MKKGHGSMRKKRKCRSKTNNTYKGGVIRVRTQTTVDTATDDTGRGNKGGDTRAGRMTGTTDGQMCGRSWV